MSAVSVELCRLGVDPAARIAAFLLHVAGPYVRRDRWLEVSHEAGGIRAAQAALAPVAHRDHAPSTQVLLDVLARQGMAPGVAIAFLQEHTELRCFGDVWVPWPESGLGNKAQAMMRVLGSPVTAETLDRALQAADANEVSSLSRAISTDARFIRTSRSTWGLRGWGLDEYGGVVTAIGQRIDAAGGAAPVAAIVADILEHYPDVAESSIRSYLLTLAFVVEKGIARRRTDDDDWPPVAPLRTARGCYRNGPNEIRIILPVDHDLLRGSGRHIPHPVADAAGVSPGQRRTFTGPGGQLTIVWRLSPTAGASVGSLRTQADTVAAAEGDELVRLFVPTTPHSTSPGSPAMKRHCPDCRSCSGVKPGKTGLLSWPPAWTAYPHTSRMCYAPAATASCSPCLRATPWRGANHASAAIS